MAEFTLDNLFADFYKFIHTFKQGRFTGFHASEIEEKIFDFNPQEALAYLDSALSVSQSILENFESVTEYFDLRMMKTEVLGTSKVEASETAERIYDQLYDFFQNEIIARLTSVKEILQAKIGNESEVDSNTTPEIDLDDGVSLPTTVRHPDQLSLDIYQSAVFFEYLKSLNVIQPFSATSLAKIVSVLTGYSEQNIRTRDGFGAIADIKSDKVGNKTKTGPHLHNLNTIKSLLVRLSALVDSEITEITKRQKK